LAASTFCDGRRCLIHHSARATPARGWLCGCARRPAREAISNEVGWRDTGGSQWPSIATTCSHSPSPSRACSSSPSRCDPAALSKGGGGNAASKIAAGERAGRASPFSRRIGAAFRLQLLRRSEGGVDVA
jgi:hypothetical protein